jgi:hypothetical protein
MQFNDNYFGRSLLTAADRQVWRSWKLMYFAIIIYERTTKDAWLPSHFTGG